MHSNTTIKALWRERERESELSACSRIPGTSSPSFLVALCTLPGDQQSPPRAPSHSCLCLLLTTCHPSSAFPLWLSHDTSLTSGGGGGSSREGSQRKLLLPPLPPSFASQSGSAKVCGGQVAVKHMMCSHLPGHFSLDSHCRLASVSPVVPEHATCSARKRDGREGGAGQLGGRKE